jgi:hypothetical protein
MGLLRHWRRRNLPRSRLLSPEYLARVIDPNLPYMSRYFDIGRIWDEAQFNRLCTLEYLHQRLGTA